MTNIKKSIKQQSSSNSNDDVAEEYCSSSVAGQILGLSNGSIYKLVNSNVLKSWKTIGGHRRISLNSIKEYLKLNRNLDEVQVTRNNLIKVLYINNGEEVFKNRNRNIEFKSIAISFEVLWHIYNFQPNLLIVELDDAQVKAHELINSFNSTIHYENIKFLIITKSQIFYKNKFKSDVNVNYLKKDSLYPWLEGFVNGYKFGDKF